MCSMWDLNRRLNDKSVQTLLLSQESQTKSIFIFITLRFQIAISDGASWLTKIRRNILNKATKC